MNFRGLSRALGLAVALLVLRSPVQSAELTAVQIIAKLDSATTNLSAELTTRLRTNVVHGSYTTVWREFEDLSIAALREILPQRIPELAAQNFDAGEANPGREKNRLADFAIRCGTNVIEVSIKAARNTGQPENDLGTFRDHANRKRLFAASFTVWVRYQQVGENFRAERVFFDRSWRFVGQSALVDGVKYRKKDGNLRPKPWAMFDANRACWKSETEFEAAVQRSETFRANELVKQYLDDLSEDDQRWLHDRLHEKFALPSKP